MSSRVHRRNSCYKVATSIYHQVFINTKNDIKLRYVYNITCSSTVISYPYLMSTKWKARSGQIRFVHVIASKECERRKERIREKILKMAAVFRRNIQRI